MTRLTRAIGTSLALAALVACDDQRTLSPKTVELSAGPGLLTASVQLPSVRVSEFHYDNGATDVEEKIEISGPAGTSLTGWSLVLYNGNTSSRSPYNTTSLNGLTITATAGCGSRGVVVVTPSVSLQDGSSSRTGTDPDGIALVNGSTVVDLVAYEGSFVAASGVAMDRTFPDIGVREIGAAPEPTSAPVWSLQRRSTGLWSAPAANTFGTCNDEAPPAPQTIASVSLTPDRTSVMAGQSQKFIATAFDASGAQVVDASVSWSSSDPLVASVDASGVVTTFTPGDVTITATTPNSLSATALLRIDAASLPDVRFSELHYDFPNDNQSVEVEGPGGMDFGESGWGVAFYDGDPGKMYAWRDLAGLIDADTCGRSYVYLFLGNLMQRGSPDGIALIKPADAEHPYQQVVEFLSYEGSFTATDGPAAGKRSVDIGKAETRNMGGSLNSLQRLRDGSAWYGPQRNTLGACNNDPSLPPVAALDGPYASTEGSPVSMSAAASNDPGGSTIVSYEWTFGDGITATGMSVSHTYTQQGTYDVTLTVTNSKALSSTARSTTTVTNIAPAIAAFSGATLIIGDTYASGSSFTDPGADSWAATVDYGDGTSGPLSLTGTSFALSHVYSSYGTFTVTVSVSDGMVTSSTSASVLVRARPVASLDGPFVSDEGSSVAMSGATSVDDDGTIVSYEWTLGDGATATGSVVSHAYSQDGSYTVALKVTDNDGLIHTTSTTITVMNVAPGIAAFPGGQQLRGETYSAAGSFTDPGDDSWIATVNYGDGTGTNALALSGKSFSLSHTYSTLGTFTVTVTVSDGGQASSRIQTVAVRARPVAAINGPFSSNEGSAVAMSGAASSDADGRIMSYEWNFGDGSDGSGVSQSHVYVQDGSYAVTLTVTDNDGLTNVATMTATVANVAPVVAQFAGATLFTGESYSVSGSFTDPGADSWTATADYGDGSTGPLALNGKAFTLSHNYTRTGTFTVIVIVSDGKWTNLRSAVVKVMSKPVATIAGNFASQEGSAIAMNGAGSIDADGTIQQYAWSFGDGSTGMGATVSHTYAQDGSYPVTLTVTDNDGFTGTSATTAQVANVTPVVSEFTGAALLQGEPYIATGSFTDPGSDTWTATVSYGDGSVGALVLSAKSFRLSHTYLKSGVYTVTVQIRDDDAIGTRSATVYVMSVTEALTYVLERVPDINSLENKIQSAIKQYAMGKANASSTVSHLNGFLDELNKAVRSGEMTAEEAAPLRELIRRVITVLTGQAPKDARTATTPSTGTARPATDTRQPASSPRLPASPVERSRPSVVMPPGTPIQQPAATSAQQPSVRPIEQAAANRPDVPYRTLSTDEAASLWGIVSRVIISMGW